MKNFDISVYGNLIVDTVYKTYNFRESHSNICDGKYISLGGAANVISALNKIDGKLELSLSSHIGTDSDGRYCTKWINNFNKLKAQKLTADLTTTQYPTSHALIISDLKKNKRSSIVKWGACSKMENLHFKKSKWHHIMYIDMLPHITENNLKTMKDNAIISIDFCLGAHSQEEKNRIFKLLKFVDFVLLSDIEAQSLAETDNMHEACTKISAFSKGAVIIHSPEVSIISSDNSKNLSTIKTRYREDLNLNVLGAGDTYTAAFIEHMMRTHHHDINDSVEHSNDYTTSLLEKGK